MRRLLIAVALLLLSRTAGAFPVSFWFNGADWSLSGDQVVPPNDSSARGNTSGEWDFQSHYFSWNVLYAGLSSPPTDVQIRGPARQGETGELLMDLFPSMSDNTTGGGSGFTYMNDPASTVLAPAFFDLPLGVRATQYLNWLWYIEVRTVAYPEGEIRAQIRTIVEPSLWSLLACALALASVMSAGQGHRAAASC